jgi:hypothetical protein
MSTKNSNDCIGNRTRDLPACGAVPQPSVPPRAPQLQLYRFINHQRRPIRVTDYINKDETQRETKIHFDFRTERDKIGRTVTAKLQYGDNSNTSQRKFNSAGIF